MRSGSTHLLLALAGGDDATVTPPPVECRDARLTIRLRVDDRLLLRERAAARAMPAATYLSVLTRAHLRSLAPLPDQERALMGRSVNELNAIGRNLNVLVRSAQQGGLPGAVTREELRALLSACEALRDHVRALIRTNTLSWEAGHTARSL